MERKWLWTAPEEEATKAEKEGALKKAPVLDTRVTPRKDKKHASRFQLSVSTEQKCSPSIAPPSADPKIAPEAKR